MNIGEAERRRQSSILVAQGLLRRAADLVATGGDPARIASIRQRAKDLLLEAGEGDLDPTQGARLARENIQDDNDDKDYYGER